jgi:hypothetical protein
VELSLAKQITHQSVKQSGREGYVRIKYVKIGACSVLVGEADKVRARKTTPTKTVPVTGAHITHKGCNLVLRQCVPLGSDWAVHVP